MMLDSKPIYTDTQSVFEGASKLYTSRDGYQPAYNSQMLSPRERARIDFILRICIDAN